MPEPPSGTITFLFTDIEGSTTRWEAHPQQMRTALQRHDDILRSAIEEQGGYVFKTVGDAFCAAFSSPTDALLATLSAQRALHSEEWPSELGEVKVRMALHTGEVPLQQGDYFGQPLNRVARILSAGHGGQTLLSEITYGLVRDALPSGASMKDMGEHHLKDLYRPERIFHLAAPDLPTEFPPLKTLDNRPNNLPAQPTPLIGREKEAYAACDMLRRPDVRLLTFTGPGGTGKTRLALQVGADLLEEFPKGVWFVELGALTNHNLVASSIAQTLGIPQKEGRPVEDTLIDYFREKHSLLVLDNFEQVMDAAPLIDTLLKAAPHLKVLVTSRLALPLYGQKEYHVPPLNLPPDPAQHLPPLETLTQYEAVRLFIERARDVKSDFAVTNESASAVAEICVRLDGLPLAIELAAARIRLFSPQALLTRLSSRLKLLTGGGVNLPRRQQTLRAAIEWSYDLLSEGDRQFFRRIAVFRGGRTLEAMEAVCNFDGALQVDVLEGVESLVQTSLLQQRDGADGEPRFVMLETIHEYAREKLQESGEDQAVREAHARFFMKLAEEAERHFYGPREPEWLDRLDEDYGNLRAAFDWSLEHEITACLQLTVVLSHFWGQRGYLRERDECVIAAFQHAGELGAAPSLVMVKVLSSASVIVANQGDPAVARRWAERALAMADSLQGLQCKVGRYVALDGLAHLPGTPWDKKRALNEEALMISQEMGDRKDEAYALGNIAHTVFTLGDLSAARSLYEQALAIYRELGSMDGVASIKERLAELAGYAEDFAAAERLCEEALALYRVLKNRSMVNSILSTRGLLALRKGDYAAARSLMEEALVTDRDIGRRRHIANTLVNLAACLYHDGDVVGARAMYEESLSLFRTSGDKKGIAECLEGYGTLAYASGDKERAARLLGAMEAIFEELGIFRDIADLAEYHRIIADLRAGLEEAKLQSAWQEGRAMSMEEAIEYALEEN
jgi:predicted ATPase/class 3 adenylate cyclase/Flp pilus assembly protein TadD